MAELYVFGQIISGSGFNNQSLFCKWSVYSGSGWKLLEGLSEGQTQVDNSEIEDCSYWSHPIDLHFVTKGIQGWPKLIFQVWNQDNFGRCNISSYGCCHIPSQPGHHKIECYTWSPLGSLKDRIINLFTGEGIKLTDEQVIFSGDERFKLQTETKGKVNLELYVVMKNFDKFGVETKSS